MALFYNRLWDLLIDRGMARTLMRLAAGISTAALVKLSMGKNVNASFLAKICNALECGKRAKSFMPRERRQLRFLIYEGCP